MLKAPHWFTTQLHLDHAILRSLARYPDARSTGVLERGGPIYPEFATVHLPGEARTFGLLISGDGLRMVASGET